MIYTANFGRGKAGLTTVGYTLYNVDATTQQARTTTGVSELGTSGIYTCDISFVDGWEGIAVFDTGEASPRYVSIGYTYQGNLDIKLSTIPALTTDGVWDESMALHNTAGTFGRRMNTWSVFRTSMLDMVESTHELNLLIKKRFKQLEKVLKTGTKGLDKNLEIQGAHLDIMDSKLTKNLDRLKTGFSKIDKDLSKLSENLKLLNDLKELLGKSKERLSLVEDSIIGRTENIELLIKDISKDKLDHKEFSSSMLALRTKEMETFNKFTNIFKLVKSGIEKLEDGLGLIAKINSKNIDADSLEDILTEEGIYNESRT